MLTFFSFFPLRGNYDVVFHLSMLASMVISEPCCQKVDPQQLPHIGSVSDMHSGCTWMCRIGERRWDKVLVRYRAPFVVGLFYRIQLACQMWTFSFRIGSGWLGNGSFVSCCQCVHFGHWLTRRWKVGILLSVCISRIDWLGDGRLESCCAVSVYFRYRLTRQWKFGILLSVYISSRDWLVDGSLESCCQCVFAV